MRRCRVHTRLDDAPEHRLDDETAHHLSTVLRLDAGTPVEVHGPGGQVAEGTLLVRGRQELWVRLTSTPRAAPGRPEVHLVLAVLKGPAMDLAVRLATEAGATHLWPVRAARSVASGDRADRWQRIAAAATLQSGRPAPPAIVEPLRLPEVLTPLGHVPDRRLCLPGEARLTAATGAVAVAVGPEGGWTPAEEQLLRDAAWIPAGLGPFTLRACTAAGIAVALSMPPG